MNLSRRSSSTPLYRFVSREWKPSSQCFCIPKTKSPLTSKRMLSTTGNAKQMGVNLLMLGRPPGLSGERVKEHCKSSTSAILKHCTDFHHPLPSVSNCDIIMNKDPSQITREAKEAIHIQRIGCPNLNRNIGKMSIPHCFDHLIGAKPKHPQVGLPSQV